MTIGRPIELPSPWRELATALGGVGALAEACGVTRWTIQRWAGGGTPPSAVLVRHVQALARRRGLEAPWG